MHIVAHGVDTVRARFDVDTPFPINDSAAADELLARGWSRFQSARVVDGDTVTTDNYSYQDEHNDSLRLFLRAGDAVFAEFSAARLTADSPVNLALADGDATGLILEDVRQLAADRLGVGLTPRSIPRLDVAVDVAAEEARPAVISAMQQIRPGRARKVTRHIYPGETSTVASRHFTARGYDKARELVNKLRPKQREEYAGLLAETEAQGRTRLEFELKPRSGFPLTVVDDAVSLLARSIEDGFPSGVVYVGGLENVRAQLDGLTRDEMSPQTKNALLAFAVRYAQLGESGMMAAYSRRTFFRHKARFLSYGFRLDDLSSWTGHVDFGAVAEELRLAA